MGPEARAVKVLVTGGGGFLGGAIVKRLLERDWDVHAFQRGSYPQLVQAGVTVHRGNLADAEGLRLAIRGCDLVIHTAAKAGVWGSYREYHQANVQGTQNVLDACLRAGVARMVYTSSPSVCFTGRDENGINESAPYARRYLAHYPRTKAEAERLVLKANSRQLATVALRPHLIWGPGDPHLVPRVLERARRGKLRMVGTRENLVDSTYIDNAAQAHVLAADKLSPAAQCAGKAYFISNGEPLPMRDLLNRILAAGGLEPVEKSISPQAAYAAGFVFESVYKLLRIKHEPLMTRFVAKQLATAHWFDLTAARLELGYRPEVSLDVGFERLKSWLRQLKP